jgi:outer membrane protein assembly factor BamA
MIKRALFLICTVFVISTPVIANDADSASTDSAEPRKAKLTAIPIINYDPSLGWNFAAMAMLFFPISAQDTISPLSMAGGTIGVTTNETWYATAFSKLYLKEDNLRLLAALGHASLNFRFYQDIPDYGGMFIGYNTLYNFGYLEVQKQVVTDWYLGARFMLLKTKTAFDVEDLPQDDQFSNQNNMGMVVSHDSRDYIYYPSTGIYANLKTGHFRDFLGSDHEYNTYEFDINEFFKLRPNKILVARISGQISAGDMPFESQNVVGREDIRGYTDGKHRAEQVYALQAEYRWNFHKRWGMVGFGGVATAVDKISQMTWSGLLPAIGTGIRFMAIEEERINLGIDVAVGDGDWGIYFRIGEVFSN